MGQAHVQPQCFHCCGSMHISGPPCLVAMSLQPLFLFGVWGEGRGLRQCTVLARCSNVCVQTLGRLAHADITIATGIAAGSTAGSAGVVGSLVRLSKRTLP
jgi:hypothetical protein